MKITEWLEAQKKLLADATPGPWKISYTKVDDSWPGLYMHEYGLPFNYGMDGEEGIYADNKNDFDFIASVRTEHERALKIIEKMREALELGITGKPESGLEKYIIRIMKEALAYFPEDGEK